MFEHAGPGANPLKRCRQILKTLADNLTFTVVAERRGLQNSGEFEVTRLVDIRLIINREKCRGIEALCPEKVFFPQTMLRNLQCIRRRVNRYRPRQVSESIRRYIFKFGSDHGAVLRQIIECFVVIVGAHEVFAGEPAGWTVHIRVEHDDLVTHGSGGRNKHAPELPTAEHTKRATGKNGHLFGGR